MIERGTARAALILSGGGARGAYEVGVLSYVIDHLAKRKPHFEFLLGTSVGAINVCYLAAHAENPVYAIRRLANLWTEIDIGEVLGFGFGQMMSLPRLFFGGGASSVGVFDVTPMSRLVEREIPWRSVTRSLRAGHLSALAVSATEVASGKTVTFMQTRQGVAFPRVAPPRTVIRETRIGPMHALASAAIPILFPQVRIGSELFMDGGVRQNTPIAPALRLGATHIFTVGLSREVRAIPRSGDEAPPNVAFVMGKVINAFMLDHIQTDFEVLERVNTIIDLGTKAFGEGFVKTVNDVAEAEGVPPVNRIETLVVRPSEDIGRLANGYLRSPHLRSGARLRRLLALLDVGEASEADLASYLLFDGAFARSLIELGRADAEAKRYEIEKFLESLAANAPPGR